MLTDPTTKNIVDPMGTFAPGRVRIEVDASADVQAGMSNTLISKTSVACCTRLELNNATAASKDNDPGPIEQQARPDTNPHAKRVLVDRLSQENAIKQK